MSEGLKSGITIPEKLFCPTNGLLSMIFLNFLALFVGNLIAAKNGIDLFLLRRIWLDFGVNEEVFVFE